MFSISEVVECRDVGGLRVCRERPVGRIVSLAYNSLNFLKIFQLAFALVIAVFAAVPATAATLDDVRERGYLICAANQPTSGFAQQSAEGLWSGFDVDFCRAISTSIFGDPGNVEFRPLSGNARFAPLQVGEVDIIVRNAPWTMRRDSSYGIRYVATSFFDGQSFLVRQSLGVVSAYGLEGVSVCVISSGDDRRNLAEFFFDNQIEYEEVLYEDRADLAVAYKIGRAHV